MIYDDINHYLIAFGKPAGHRRWPQGSLMCTGGGVGGLDSHEAKTHSKRTKEQVQAKNRNKNNTFQSDTPAGRRIPKVGHHSNLWIYDEFWIV